MSWRFVGCLLFTSALAGAAWAQPPAGDNRNALPVTSAAALAGAFRNVLLQTLPDPLYQSSPGWGATRRVVTAVAWIGTGADRHPQTQFAERNDGTWRKVRLVADRPAETLAFALPDFRSMAPDRIAFTAVMACDARVYYEKQKWRVGVRVYSTSARARLRIKLTLACELTGRLETARGALVPDVVLRLRVLRADAGYDNLVVEHIAGVGGDMAKLLGKAVRQGLHRFDPRLEKELLAKADRAIERAAESKEVRLSIAAFLK